MEARVTATTRDLFDICMRARLQGRCFYSIMSKAFSYLPRAALSWHDLMLSESKDLVSLRAARDKLRADELDEPIDPLLVRRTERALSILSKEEILRIETLDDAYELANRIANSEASTMSTVLIMRCVSTAWPADIALREILDHASQLAKLSEAFGDRAWRRRQPPLIGSWPQEVDQIERLAA